MVRRCGCASDSCSCVVLAGSGMVVNGSGSESNPYVVTSTVADIQTGFTVQYNNTDVIRDVHRIDFRGAAVTVSPGTDEAVVTVTVPDPTTGATIPAGSMWMFGGAAAPAGWLLCNGATILISAQPALFAAIGINFGGNGTTNFMLPNMGDRAPVGVSATKAIVGASSSGGTESKGIALGNLPPHTHPMNHDHASANSATAGPGDYWVIRNGTGNFNIPAQSGTGNAATAGGDVHRHAVDLPNFSGNTASPTGATATPLDVMQPWRALSFIIKT
jgi:microcystin-dependent protein